MSLLTVFVVYAEQFPRCIQDKRRSLIPVIHEARRNGKKANLVVDKLYINNKLYNPAWGHIQES